jgi:hypothetical protein
MDEKDEKVVSLNMASKLRGYLLVKISEKFRVELDEEALRRGISTSRFAYEIIEEFLASRRGDIRDGVFPAKR